MSVVKPSAQKDSEEEVVSDQQGQLEPYTCSVVSCALTEPVWHPATSKGLQFVKGSVQYHCTDLRVAHGSPRGSKTT